MNRPVAFVTGASRGIGRATAVCFGKEGFAVGLFARTAAGLDETAREVRAAGGHALALAGDVTDADALERAAAKLAETYGGIDVLVNNAGITKVATVDRLTPTDFRRVLEVNLVGSFLATRATLPWLLKSARAHVFNVGSVASYTPFDEWSAYCASKFGLLGFSGSLRAEVRGKGVRVTDVLPGPVDTEIWSDVPGDWSKAKMIRAEDVAEAIRGAWKAPPECLIEELRIGPTGGVL